MLALKVRGSQGRDEYFALPGLRSEMNRLFDTFIRDPLGNLQENLTGGWQPALDLAETDKEVSIRAELPGVKPEEIDISVHGDHLTLVGEKKETWQKEENGFHHKETRYGKFSRTVTLPENLDTDAISAEFSHGVLVIKLPKVPAAQPKKVSVKVN
ncbi:MAG: Hsp20/alpha crystallin family protein [Pirellulales bacterium]|nr:Hsp20/alpha crystallin family protein [Pirellulales bacterium]